MTDTEPLDLDAHDRVARTLHDRADAICADRDGDLNQVDELLAAETSIEALIAEVRRLREENRKPTLEEVNRDLAIERAWEDRGLLEMVTAERDDFAKQLGIDPEWTEADV